MANDGGAEPHDICGVSPGARAHAARPCDHAQPPESPDCLPCCLICSQPRLADSSRDGGRDAPTCADRASHGTITYGSIRTVFVSCAPLFWSAGSECLRPHCRRRSQRFSGPCFGGWSFLPSDASTHDWWKQQYRGASHPSSQDRQQNRLPARRLHTLLTSGTLTKGRGGAREPGHV